MKYAIITGASKGLGLALAKRLIHEQIPVLSVSRTENEELKNLAKEKGVDYSNDRSEPGRAGHLVKKSTIVLRLSI